MDGEIRFVGDLQRLELKPDDTLVLRSKVPVSFEMRETLEMILKEKFPGVTVLVLDSDLDIGAIGKG